MRVIESKDNTLFKYTKKLKERKHRAKENKYIIEGFRLVQEATIDKRELKSTDEMAILNIAGTSTHHVLFLDAYSSTAEIEAELKEADAKINHTTLKIIGGHL